jgi:hypothetical protein
MPRPRGDRETRAAIAVTFSRPVPRAARAPGEPGQDPQPRHRGLTALTPRNGLPEPGGYAYRGTGHDMTGDCQCGTPCQWAGRSPRVSFVSDEELQRRIASGRTRQRELARRELDYRKATLRATLRAARLAALPETELDRRIASGTKTQREGAHGELRRREAQRRDILARRAG